MESIDIENLDNFKLPTNNVLSNRNVVEVFRIKTSDFILIVLKVVGS